MPTKLDQRRLNDGAKAKALPSANTIEELETLIENLDDGIRAMQSLDDLGSPEANAQADRDMMSLMKRSDQARVKLDNLLKA